MVQNDFPQLGHPSPLPMVLQNDKRHKESMFFHQLHSISFLRHFVSKIHLFHVCMGDLLKEGSLVGAVYRNIFWNFP